MKKGDTVKCPHCGESTVVKINVIMNGWTKAGEVFACPLCNGELGKVDPARPAAGPAGGDVRKLSALLGEELHQSTVLTRTESDGHFCANCAHCLTHPFQSRCGKTGRAIDPMGDCPQFERKSSC